MHICYTEGYSLLGLELLDRIKIKSPKLTDRPNAKNMIKQPVFTVKLGRTKNLVL